jgi:hypothetical protein
MCGVEYPGSPEEEYEVHVCHCMENGTHELVFLGYAAAIVTYYMQRQIIILPCYLHTLYRQGARI